jgi:hypothetical protein
MQWGTPSRALGATAQPRSGEGDARGTQRDEEEAGSRTCRLGIGAGRVLITLD